MTNILLTGATGYIGNRLLERLLGNEQNKVFIPIRGDVAARKQALLNGLPASAVSRVQVIESDLENLPTHLRPHLKDLNIIVHNAAKTAFNVDEDSANKINRDASLRIFEMASDAPNLKKIVYVSTLYTSGLTGGKITENFFTSPSFANHYERSKWETEEAIRTRFAKLPWNIVRVATVLAENNDGQVIQQNAIHNTLKLFYYGLISLLPGKAETPVHLVDGDFVTDALEAVVTKAPAQKIYHACYPQSQSIPLGKFIDVAFEEFNKDEIFKTRRLLKPLFADEKSFDTLVTNMKGFGGTVLNQGLSSISPFGRQLFIKKEVENTELLSLLKNTPKWDVEKMVRNTCLYLSKTKFAKASSSSPVGGST